MQTKPTVENGNHLIDLIETQIKHLNQQFEMKLVAFYEVLERLRNEDDESRECLESNSEEEKEVRYQINKETIFQIFNRPNNLGC